MIKSVLVSLVLLSLNSYAEGTISGVNYNLPSDRVFTTVSEVKTRYEQCLADNNYRGLNMNCEQLEVIFRNPEGNRSSNPNYLRNDTLVEVGR